jgi:hypothetical protein
MNNYTPKTKWGFVGLKVKSEYTQDTQKLRTFKCSETLWKEFKTACKYNNTNATEALSVLMSYFIDKTNAEIGSNENAPKLREMISMPLTKQAKALETLSLQDKMEFYLLQDELKRVEKYTKG